MNYLSHFVYNHDVCGIAEDANFALGVTLPDLWVRFSRTKRIRWRAVRAARPRDEIDAALQGGLLNHVAVDRRFHVLPAFLIWQRAVKGAVVADGVHPALLDFLAHAAVEIALDHHLIQRDAALAERYYDRVAACDAKLVATRVGALGAVDTTGLDGIIANFVRRRFLRQYREAAALPKVLHIVLSLADIPKPPPELLGELTDAAIGLSDPAIIWEQMGSPPQLLHTRAV